MSWKVKQFQTSRGTQPVREFAEKQNKKDYARILQAITLLRNTGPFLKPPYIIKLLPNLYELRTSNIRIFYTFKNDAYYLVHAIKKKSQKTPRKDMKIAIDRMKEIV